MRVIGVCGGSGSGKSTVSACFSSLGGLVLDADAIYHELIGAPSPCVDAIAAAFGREVAPDGKIDRDRLRGIVFQDKDALSRLNKISHAFVGEEIERRLKEAEEAGEAFCVIDAPLLLEAGMDSICDLVVAVIAPFEVRISRIVQRDSITPDAARERIRQQLSDDELLLRCDSVIRNDGKIEDLMRSCREILHLLGIQSKKRSEENE